MLMVLVVKTVTCILCKGKVLARLLSSPDAAGGKSCTKRSLCWLRDSSAPEMQHSLHTTISRSQVMPFQVC